MSRAFALVVFAFFPPLSAALGRAECGDDLGAERGEVFEDAARGVVFPPLPVELERVIGCLADALFAAGFGGEADIDCRDLRRGGQQQQLLEHHGAAIGCLFHSETWRFAI